MRIWKEGRWENPEQKEIRIVVTADEASSYCLYFITIEIDSFITVIRHCDGISQLAGY